MTYDVEIPARDTEFGDEATVSASRDEKRGGVYLYSGSFFGHITDQDAVTLGFGLLSLAGVSVVRDDPGALVQSAHVQALIAAAVEGAAEVTREGLVIVAPDGLGQRQALASYRDQISAMILHLTLADHKAALDRMLQEAKNEALREAIRLCVPHISTPSATAMTIGNLADAIQSLIQEPPR